MHRVNMGTIRSINRAFDILQAFTVEKPSLTIDEIAKSTGIPNSTVYRILCTLEQRGMVKFEQNSLTYKPGLRLLKFGLLMSSLLDVRQEAVEILIELQHRTSQTVLMAVREDDEILYVFKKENQEGLKVSSLVGLHRPYRYGVLGPVLLAFLPETHIERILNIPLTQPVPYKTIDPDLFRHRLQLIKKERVYVESNETAIGVTGISAPVFDVNKEAVAAIAVIGPSVQLDDQVEEVKHLVLEASEKISARLGFQGK